MHITMDYGKQGLVIDVPDNADVFEVRPCPGLPDETAAICQALEHPIGSPSLPYLVKPGAKVVLTHTDITRATPNQRLLPVILEALLQAGVTKQDITLLNALGTHRPQTKAELRQMLGDAIVDTYRCLQHDAFDAARLVRVGTASNGNPIRLNRHLVEADLVIFTGFIEPHFFAGYSGGPKAVLPALAGAESVYSNHAYSMIAHPNATFNQLEGNPIWEEMHEAARMLPNTLLVNVTLNRSGQITGVFAGDVIAAHAEGCNFANQFNQVHLPTLYDVVITSNSGYPLDQNLYQCVKGLAAARRAVRQGGAILLVAACQEGLPDNSSYAQLLQSVKTPQQALHMLAQPGFRMQDAWQVQIQAAIQMHADVFLYSEELSDVQIQSSLLRVCRNIPQTLRELAQTYGSRICVLPEGPLVIVNPPDKAQNHKH